MIDKALNLLLTLPLYLLFITIVPVPCPITLPPAGQRMSPLSMSSASSHRERVPSTASHYPPQQAPPTPSAKSHRTYASEQYSEYEHQPSVYTDMESGTQIDMDLEMEELEGEAVHFCLLAEFDIDAGATLTDQYPHPTGTDEQ